MSSYTQPAIVADDSPPIITLSRNLAIRILRHSDAEEMARMANNRKILRNMSGRFPDPYTVDRAHDFICRMRNQDDWHPIGPKSTNADDKEKDTRQKLPVGWAIVQDDKFIGSIGIQLEKDIYSRCLSFGYWIAEEYWGQGIMTEVATAFVKWMWEVYVDIVRIEGNAYSWNPASGRVLEKAGLIFERRARAKVWRYGEFCDLMEYAAVREGTVVAEV